MKLQALVTVPLLAITGCYIDEQSAGQVKDAVPFKKVESHFGEYELHKGNIMIKIAGKLDYRPSEDGNVEELKKFSCQGSEPRQKRCSRRDSFFV